MAIDQMYLENLEEYINDENKIVTYKWLSKTLEVHVNQAKQMLYSFLDQERNKNDNDKLTVTYFVSGFVTNGNTDEKVQKMVIVPEENLEPTKCSFKPLTSCHVYSVQKCKVKDTGSLYAADVELLKEQILQSNKYSAIKCISAKPRSGDELSKLRTVAQPTKNAPSFTKPVDDTVQKSKPPPEQKNKKPAGIAGMFAAGGKKKEENKKNADTKNGVATSAAGKKAETSKAQKGKAGGISNFFGSQASKPKKTKTEEEDKDDVILMDVEDSNSTDMKDKKSQDKKTSPVKTKSPSPKPKAKTSGRRKAEDSDDDENSQQKKRRRIKKQVWSDSSDDEQAMEEEEPLPVEAPPSPAAEVVEKSPEKQQPSPLPSPVKSTPSPAKTKNTEKHKDTSSQSINSSIGSISSSGKKRKRQKKLISKTSVDDSGYMVTEKVWEDVSESASEGEDLIPPTPPVKAKQQTKKKTPTKKTSPESKSATKQKTMMSFFKKQ